MNITHSCRALALIASMCVSAWASADDLILVQDSFSVQYAEGDEYNAQQVLQILNRAKTQIQGDLAVTVSPEIRVILAASEQHYQSLLEDDTPDWAQGVTFVRGGGSVLLLRSPKWSGEALDFSPLVIHELSHAMLSQAVRYQFIPRWFNEGLAIFYSKDLRWISTSNVSKAILTRSLIALDEIENVNSYASNRAHLAYQESHLAVRYLIETYGWDAVRAIITGLGEGRDIDDIFFAALGLEFWEFENRWIEYLEKRYKWSFFLEFQSYLWVAILLLTAAAFIVVQYRKRRILRQWSDEELFHENG